jgi:hypothetical protein
MALRTPSLHPIGVPALGELLDDLCTEGGQVVGAAARDEPLVDDHLFVGHVRARVAQVRTQAGERRDPPPRQDAGLEQRPGPVADGPDRFPGVEELPHEVEGALVHPELVGVHRAARQQQRVVVVDGGVRDEAVDREGPRVLEVVVARRDLAVVDRQQLHLRAGILDRPARLFELHALDAVGGQDRDTTVTQDVAHGSCSFLGDSASVRRAPRAVMRRSRHLRLGSITQGSAGSIRA